MSLLRSVHEESPVNPTLDPEVMAKVREIDAAWTAMTALEARLRALERDRDSSDELRVLTAAHELFDLQRQYMAAQADLLRARQAYDAAFQVAQIPWQTYWRERYREAALKFLRFLEDEALVANDEMLMAQAAAEQAGLRVEPLHVPHLTAEAIAHRARIGRQGLK